MESTWHFVLQGVGMLGHWQTYVAALAYLLIAMLMPLGASLLFSRRPDAEAGSGCLTVVMVPVLEVWAMVTFVMTLSPIVLGVSTDADWGLPWRAIGEAGRQTSALLGGLTLLGLVLNAIPLSRRLWSLHAFLLGSIILVFSVSLVAPEVAETTRARQISYLPSPMLALAILAIVVAMSVLEEIVSATTHAILGEPSGPVRHLLISPISALPGFVPVFVYGAWLGGQL